MASRRVLSSASVPTSPISLATASERRRLRRDRAPAPTAGTIALMSIENVHAHPDEVTALREEVARLLQELRMALEMLQIMQEELQAAHDALSSN